jgi:hypothetical protein
MYIFAFAFTFMAKRSMQYKSEFKKGSNYLTPWHRVLLEKLPGVKKMLN